MNVRQNAPRTVGSSSRAACSSVASAAPCASSAPRMSESVVAAGAPRVAEQPGLAGAGGQVGGIDQVAVVAERDPGACGGVAEHRLGVFPGGGSAGGVATVADGDVALHRGQCLLVEDLADQAEVLEHEHLRAVGDGDARRFLAAVLKRVQAVVGEFGDLFARRPDAEYATLFAGFLIGLLTGHDRAAPKGVGDAFSLRSSRVNHGIERQCRRLTVNEISTTVITDSIPDQQRHVVTVQRALPCCSQDHIPHLRLSHRS